MNFTGTYVKIHCLHSSATWRGEISHQTDNSKAALSPSTAWIVSVGGKGIDFRRHTRMSTGEPSQPSVSILAV